MHRNVHQLLEKVELLVDGEGRIESVIIEYSSWEDLLNWIEDVEDCAEIEASRTSGEETIPWEEAKAELRAKGINV